MAATRSELLFNIRSMYSYALMGNTVIDGYNLQAHSGVEKVDLHYVEQFMNDLDSSDREILETIQSTLIEIEKTIRLRIREAQSKR